MTMKRKLILSVFGIMLLIVACNNPFFPEKETDENPADPAVPVISSQPQGGNYRVDGIAAPLTVTASVSDGGTLSYRWYGNNINDNVNGTFISNAINLSYTPPTNTAGVIYYYVIVTNTLNGKTAGVASNTAAITVREETPTYSIHIDITGKESGDTITFSPDTGKEGDIVTINYTVANTKLNNSLNFSGTTTHIAPVNSEGGGVRQYTVNAADASNGVINIRAVFFHADLNLDQIAFNDDRGVIHVTYGDPAFTNAVASGYSGSGAITYTSSNTSVANVNNSGQVTIYKAGFTIIKAEKAEDSVYAYAQTDYTLNVDPKPLTITGLSVQDKTYDSSAVATVSGTAVLNGKVGSDNVTIVTGTAAFTDANAGTNKQVIFNGWSLSGADAGNYTLSLPKINANINKADGRTVTKPASTTITASSITVGAVTVSTPAYGQTAEYTISLNESPVPATGWQDGTTFNGLNANTNYYVFARSKSNANCNAGTAQISNVIKTSSGGGQPPEVPRTTVIDFEDKAINTAYGFTRGDNDPTVKVVADPASSGQKSLQITTNAGNGSQGYNQAAVIPINLPYELQKYKSFSFRLRIIGGAGLASAQTVHVYAAKNSNSFVRWGFGNPSNNQNQFAANLVGSTTLTTTTTNTWTNYVITITAANLDNAIKTLQGDINIAIGINVGSAADYMIDDLTFTLMDDYFPEPPFMLPTTPLSPPSTGAVVSGNYRNMFVEMGKSPAEVTAKLQYAWDHLFYGRTQDANTNDSNNKNDCIYYPVGSDMAYIWAADSNDVRSEGMSYGMMMCVQLDKKEEFDRLWKWSKTYMYNTASTKNGRGYFAWQCSTSGSKKDESPAPDGEIYFITSLLFASARWGDGAGIFNYGLEARKILYELIRRKYPDQGGIDPYGEPPLFNTTNYMVRFGPLGDSGNFTDPSYHLPAFYEIWAEEIESGTQHWNAVWGNSTEPLADAQFWRNAAAASRTYFPTTTHPTTGLGPDYSNFDGTPRGSGNHARFEYDAWRIAMNIASDYAWWAKDSWEKTHADRILAFFDGKGITSYGDRWELNGTQVGADHSTGLVACNAVASLAATDPRAWKFLDEFWNKGVDTGYYRYYNNCLYMLAMLHCSGNFRAYTSSGAKNSSITPTSATFDKRLDLQNDIVVTMSLNGNTLTAIKNGAATLSQGTNYTLSGNTVTINKSYLNTLAVGTTTLTFVFSSGSDRTLSITVQQTPAGQATAITPTTAVFDKRPDLQSDIPVTITLDGNAFSSITNTGVTVAAGNYTIAGNTLTLKSSYLASLSVGSVTLVFNFTGGITRNLVITVKESPAAGSLHTEYNFATGGTIPAGYPTYLLNGGDPGTLPTAVLSGGVLVVTRASGNHSSPIFYLPFNIGTDNLSNYDVVIRMKNVSGADNKGYNIYIGNTRIGNLGNTGLNASFKDVTINLTGGAGSSGEVVIGFAQDNSPGYTYEIESIKLVKK